MSPNETEPGSLNAETDETKTQDARQAAAQTGAEDQKKESAEMAPGSAAGLSPKNVEGGRENDKAGSGVSLAKEPERIEPAPDAVKTDSEKELHGEASAGALTKGRCLVMFNALAHVGPLALLVFLAFMVWADFWFSLTGEAFYCPPEATAITTFLNSAASGDFFQTAGISGGALTAQWPAFTWLCALLALIPMPPGLLWPLAGSVCAAFLLLAVWYLAKSCRFGSKVAFAGGLILLCTPVFAPLGHFVGRGALAAALTIFAIACFTRGWLKKRAWFSLPIAFAATAFAGLTAGPYCVALPLLASICFLIWIGKPGRASRADAIFGFVLLLAVLGTWLGLVMLKGTNESGYLSALLGNLWLSPWPPAADWWFSGLTILLGALPWVLLVICVSWFRVGKESRLTLAASRRDNGSAMLWISAVIAWLLTFVIADSLHLAVVTGVALLAVLCGKAFLNLPGAGHRLFFFICAIGLLCAALFMFGISFDFSQPYMLQLLPVPLPAGIAQQLSGMAGLWVAGALCLFGVIVIALRFLRGDQGGGPLIFCTMLCVFLTQPAVLMIAPELGKNGAARLLTLQDIEAAFANLPPAINAAPVAPKPDAPAPAVKPPAIPGLTVPQNEPSADTRQGSDAAQSAPQPDQTPNQAQDNAASPENTGMPETAPEQDNASAPENVPSESAIPAPQSGNEQNPASSQADSNTGAHAAPDDANAAKQDDTVIIFNPQNDTGKSGAALPDAPANPPEILIVEPQEAQPAAPQNGE